MLNFQTYNRFYGIKLLYNNDNIDCRALMIYYEKRELAEVDADIETQNADRDNTLYDRDIQSV